MLTPGRCDQLWVPERSCLLGGLNCSPVPPPPPQPPSGAASLPPWCSFPGQSPPSALSLHPAPGGGPAGELSVQRPQVRLLLGAVPRVGAGLGALATASPERCPRVAAWAPRSQPGSAPAIRASLYTAGQSAPGCGVRPPWHFAMEGSAADAVGLGLKKQKTSQAHSSASRCILSAPRAPSILPTVP